MANPSVVDYPLEHRGGEELRRLEERLAHELLNDEAPQELRDRVLALRRRSPDNPMEA